MRTVRAVTMVGVNELIDQLGIRPLGALSVVVVAIREPAGSVTVLRQTQRIDRRLLHGVRDADRVPASSLVGETGS